MKKEKIRKTNDSRLDIIERGSTLKILIGADLVPTQRNYHLFQTGAVDELIGNDLYRKLRNADFTIFNLEVPLTDEVDPIIKHGMNLIASTSTICGLKAINPHFFTIANNHILDQGEQGLDSTVKLLNQFGIAYAGAGKNLKEASAPYIKCVNGIKVGIYCCAEHEFTIATESSAGANPFDPLESLDHVSELKSQCDYVIVLYHGGKEHYRYPAPYLQKVCRKLIDKGADFVVCQHSHCIGATEKYHSGQIIYGQGNFLFDYSESEYWQTGLLIELEIKKLSGRVSVSTIFHPLLKCKEKVRLASADRAEKILNEFNDRSKKILSAEFVQTEYVKYSASMINSYLSGFMGTSNRNLLIRIINKLTGYKFLNWRIKKRFKNRDRLVFRNYIECEAHRELILQGLSTENNNP